jgi:hypothetical protein
MMAELIQVYDQQVRTRDNVAYAVQAMGARRGHVWHGWLEFVPIEGGLTLRTERETTQPDRGALGYWASGLEPVYIEGALSRARAESSSALA